MLIEQLKNLHHQATVPAAILMAIRAKIEAKREVKERINKGFEGNRGVLVVGKAGTGKSRVMKKIYNGLGLDTINSAGKQVGKYLDSAGASTAIGIYETLEIYNDSILFIDEMSLDTPKHLHILKQVAHNKIARQKHNALDEFDFTGMLVCSTNAIRLPRSNNLRHLFAVLDRFYTIQAKPPDKKPEDYADLILGEEEEKDVDWKIIRQALMREGAELPNRKEKAIFKHVWRKKTGEILDPTRAHYRSCQTAYDIFLFVKRFFNTDLSKDKMALKFAIRMINDTVSFNFIGLLDLTPLEEVIYNKIASKAEVTLQGIVGECESVGMSVSVRHIHNVLNKLIYNRIIFRSRHGYYSIKKIEGTKQKKSEIAEVL